MQADLFDYLLPPNRIAQAPIQPRDASKLLVCQVKGRLGAWESGFSYSHKHFSDISEILGSQDFVVVNDSKVLPVRLLGQRQIRDRSVTQPVGHVEVLLLKRLSAELDLAPGAETWEALVHLAAKIKPGLTFLFEPGLVGEVVSTHEERIESGGIVRLKFSGVALERMGMQKWLERHGHVPLPPYIEREDTGADKDLYQTVYASHFGSAAAPTAGFHFTDKLLEKLKNKGVEIATVTLHVGLGTFRPIKVDNIDDHQMHEETFKITDEFACRFDAAKRDGKRIVAVGTTVVRTLESWAEHGSGPERRPGTFATSKFIKPGYTFNAVDDLITNFHLPRSTLLVLIGAAMGIEPMREAYQQAIAGGYRFFSYGDAMMIRGSKL